MNERLDSNRANLLQTHAPSSGQRPIRACFSGSFSIDTMACGTSGKPVPSEQDGLSHLHATGLDLSIDPRRARLAQDETSLTIVCGQPKGRDAVQLDMATIGTRLARGDAEPLDAWLGGHFSIVHLDLSGRRAYFVTSRFSTSPIC